MSQGGPHHTRSLLNDAGTERSAESRLSRVCVFDVDRFISCSRLEEEGPVDKNLRSLSHSLSDANVWVQFGVRLFLSLLPTPSDLSHRCTWCPWICFKGAVEQMISSSMKSCLRRRPLSSSTCSSSPSSSSACRFRQKREHSVHYGPSTAHISAQPPGLVARTAVLSLHNHITCIGGSQGERLAWAKTCVEWDFVTRLRESYTQCVRDGSPAVG